MIDGATGTRSTYASEEIYNTHIFAFSYYLVAGNHKFEVANYRDSLAEYDIMIEDKYIDIDFPDENLVNSAKTNIVYQFDVTKAGSYTLSMETNCNVLTHLVNLETNKSNTYGSFYSEGKYTCNNTFYYDVGTYYFEVSCTDRKTSIIADISFNAEYIEITELVNTSLLICNKQKTVILDISKSGSYDIDFQFTSNPIITLYKNGLAIDQIDTELENGNYSLSTTLEKGEYQLEVSSTGYCYMLITSKDSDARIVL